MPPALSVPEAFESGSDRFRFDYIHLNYTNKMKMIDEQIMNKILMPDKVHRETDEQYPCCCHGCDKADRTQPFCSQPPQLRTFELGSVRDRLAAAAAASGSTAHELSAFTAIHHRHIITPVRFTDAMISYSEPVCTEMS